MIYYLTLIFLFILSYLIGSIPFGLILSKLSGYGDIRMIGSGNIGATNVLRTGNKLLALFVLLLDSIKGYIAVKNLYLFSPPEMFDIIVSISALGVVLGHCFPIWLKFKGGKGVATAIGVIFALQPISGLTTVLLWIIVALIFKKSSLSSLASLMSASISILILSGSLQTLSMIIIIIISFYRHKENIYRLMVNKEPKIFDKINLNFKNLIK